MSLHESDWNAIRSQGWPFFATVHPEKSARRPGHIGTTRKPISPNGNIVVLSRFLMKPTKHEHVGYVNGDEFDLCRENLRIHKAGEWRLWGIERAEINRNKADDLGVPW